MFKRGSEWRIWDLEVHTPCSILNNQFGNDWNAYTKILINKAIDQHIAVIGITDYFTIKGYQTLTEILNNDVKLKSIFEKELKQEKNYLDKIKNIKFFPCCEFRFKDVVIDSDHTDKIKGNFIFSDEISPEDIVNKFLSKLTFVNQNNEKIPLTEYNVSNFGKNLKLLQPELRNKSDYVAGLENLYIDFLETIKVLQDDDSFKDKYIILLPEDPITSIDWDSGPHMTRERYYIEAHGLFRANKNSINWRLKENIRSECYKPCFSCSDCHKFDEMFNFKSNKKCWIKADPTFNGFKQVFFQQKERLYIGDKPLKLQIKNNKSHYYIDKILINKKPNAKNEDNWFNAEISLNTGLVAIIGNKGSGKSALADILGYMTNSKNIKKASFLTNERFRKEDKRFADDYQSKLFWKDGRIIKKNSLDYEIDEIQSAEYLPQKYINELCNESNNNFQEEISKVIFSYIDIYNKNQCTNLAELISKKTVNIDYQIKKCRINIETINEKIIQLEEKFTDKYKEDIEAKLHQKKILLESNKKNKPKKVYPPTNTQSNDLINELNKKIDKIEKKISQKQEKKLNINISLDKIYKYLEKFKFSTNKIESLIAEGNLISQDLGISDTLFVDIKSNINLLKEKFDTLSKQNQILHDQLDENVDFDFNETHMFLYIEKKKMIESRENALITAHESEIKYQNYLDDLKIWEKENEKLQGKSNKDEDTIEFYQNELNYINEGLYSEIEKLYNDRMNMVLKIYNLYKDKMRICQDLCYSIEEKIKHIPSFNSEHIEFEAVININNNFKTEFMSYITQDVNSAYKSKIEGTEYLNSAIREVDFNTYEGLKSFIEKMQFSVSNNKNNIKRLIPNTLGCYNYLNKLEFLNISFTLKINGKTLNKLSPEQRENAVLILYLALSKNSNPIIIDLPEDNFDNKSVFDKLVPYITEAKKHRQVIIAMHNPNIAIACDAEQIIYSTIDKTKNKISYTSGSIENEEIRQKVVDMLEEAWPAFTLKRLKYSEKNNKEKDD